MTKTEATAHTLHFDSTIGEGDEPRHHVILITTCTGRPAMIVDPQAPAYYGTCPDCGQKL